MPAHPLPPGCSWKWRAIIEGRGYENKVVQPKQISSFLLLDIDLSEGHFPHL